MSKYFHGNMSTWLSEVSENQVDIRGLKRSGSGAKKSMGCLDPKEDTLFTLYTSHATDLKSLWVLQPPEWTRSRGNIELGMLTGEHKLPPALRHGGWDQHEGGAAHERSRPGFRRSRET